MNSKNETCERCGGGHHIVDCDGYGEDIRKARAPRPCTHKRIDHNGECLDCDEPVWVGGDELLEDALVHLKGANESGDPAAWIDHAIEKIETRLKSPRPIPGLQEAIDPEMPTQQLRLHMGELTASEVRVARAAIAWANSRQSGVPDGWVVVPREPTEEIEGLDEAIEHFKYTTVVNWSDPTVSKMFEALKEAAKRYQGRGG